VKKVLITRKLFDGAFNRLKRSKFFGEIELDYWDQLSPIPKKELEKRAVGCNAILCSLEDQIDKKIIQNNPQLSVISNYAVGVNNIDTNYCREKSIPVGHTPGVLTEATADLSFALLISAARNIVSSSQSIPKGDWKYWDPEGHLGIELAGKSLGIVGAGRIGKAMAYRAHHGFNMKIQYFNRSKNSELEKNTKAQRVDLSTLARESDFVSIHLPLNDQTVGFIGRDFFNEMKETAILINTARGKIINQSELYQILKDRKIFAAALDVTDPEPLPPGHQLLTLSNCLITPHIGSSTFQTRLSMASIAVENLIDGLEGRELTHRFC
jgi:glyoxylate reductase